MKQRAHIVQLHLPPLVKTFTHLFFVCYYCLSTLLLITTLLMLLFAHFAYRPFLQFCLQFSSPFLPWPSEFIKYVALKQFLFYSLLTTQFACRQRGVAVWRDGSRRRYLIRRWASFKMLLTVNQFDPSLTVSLSTWLTICTFVRWRLLFFYYSQRNCPWIAPLLHPLASAQPRGWPPPLSIESMNEGCWLAADLLQEQQLPLKWSGQCAHQYNSLVLCHPHHQHCMMQCSTLRTGHWACCFSSLPLSWCLFAFLRHGNLPINNVTCLPLLLCLPFDLTKECVCVQSFSYAKVAAAAFARLAHSTYL